MKSAKMNIIYVIGMALVAVGFCLPVFSGILGSTSGWDFVGDHFSGWTLGVLLIFIGAAAGIVCSFAGVSKANMIKLICLAASIAGGIMLIIYINNSSVYRIIAKQFLKHAAVGFYMIIAGWFAGIVGYVTGK
jgi:hypothetical protein